MAPGQPGGAAGEAGAEKQEAGVDGRDTGVLRPSVNEMLWGSKFREKQGRHFPELTGPS